MSAKVRQELQEALEQRFGESLKLPEDLTETAALQLATIAGHRSHRAYTSEQIDADLVRLLCACALSAPAKSDLQQADIVIVSNAAKRRAIEALIPSMPWIADAPLFLVFCGNGKRIRDLAELHGKPFANEHLDGFFNPAVDTALVLMNFIRAAEAAGLGCCPISVVRNHAETVSEVLSLPEWVFPVAGMCVGYPARPRLITPRLPLRLTIHTDSYDDSQLAADIAGYDRRRDQVLPFRTQRYADEYGEDEFYGWSEDKVRQVSKPERADFGKFVRHKKFKLD